MDKITASEIHNLVNKYLRTPANAYILTDDDKATLAEFNLVPGLIAYPGTPLPMPDIGSPAIPNTLVAGANVDSTLVLAQLQRWSNLYARVRYCKFHQTISGGAVATIEPYYKYCSFVTVPLVIDPNIPTDVIRTFSGVTSGTQVNTVQQITDALTSIVPTLEMYWTEPEYGIEFGFCHSSCHGSCHGARNRR